MKIRSILLALLAVILLNGCTDKEGDSTFIEKSETKAVYLKVKNNRQNQSRADEASEDGNPAELLSTIIYFIDSATDPLIYAVRTVGVDGDVTLAQIEDGYEFQNIPSSVTEVYVVGNYNSSDEDGDTAAFPINIGGNLSDVEDVVLNIQQVAYPELADGSDGEGLLTVLTGRAEVQEYGPDTEDDWGGEVLEEDDLFAEVPISPVNARLEIVSITYMGTLTSFTLEGIYINNYYQESPVNLDLTGYDVINSGTNADFYDITEDDYAYEDYSVMYDRLNIDLTPSATGGTSTVTPANGVWGYNVFGNSDPVPHIILRLTDVTGADGVNRGTQFVTVRGYRNGPTEVSEFVRNTIYRILSLEFNDEDISIFPEPENVNLWIHVTVTPWTTIDVTPII